MKIRFVFTLTLLVVLCNLTIASAQTMTIVDLRLGMRSQATYHLAEVFQVRDRWIVPDVGYIDFADAGNYREWFVGARYNFIMTRHVTVAEYLYFVQAAGPTSDNARYIQPWTGVFWKFPNNKLSGEAEFFPYIPFNKTATHQWVIEHAKLEYAFSSVLKAGVGYGAYQLGDDKWQHKPFVAVTVTPADGKFGSLEFWLQKLPDGGNQVQVRYELVHIGKKK